MRMMGGKFLIPPRLRLFDESAGFVLSYRFLFSAGKCNPTF